MLHEFGELLVDRWDSGQTVEQRESAHAGRKALKELIEVLNDRIDAELGDERDDGATEG